MRPAVNRVVCEDQAKVEETRKPREYALFGLFFFSLKSTDTLGGLATKVELRHRSGLTNPRHIHTASPSTTKPTAARYSQPRHTNDQPSVALLSYSSLKMDNRIVCSAVASFFFRVQSAKPMPIPPISSLKKGKFRPPRDVAALQPGRTNAVIFSNRLCPHTHTPSSFLPPSKQG